LAGFVVCASCGTQIKAGRAYCLRCGEKLPDEGQPVKVSVWESLELSQSKVWILLAIVALIVLSLVLVIWQSQPPPIDDLNVPGGAIYAVPSAPKAVAASRPPRGSRTVGSSRY
jgi:hypothetical protein